MAAGGAVTKDQFLAVYASMMFVKKRVRMPIVPQPGTEKELIVPIDVLPGKTTAVDMPPGLQIPDSIRSIWQKPFPQPKGSKSSNKIKMPRAAAAAAAPEQRPREKEEECYKVLLRGVPEAMAYESVMWAALEQAQLDSYATRLDFRAGGKVLITFSTFSSMDRCILHFDGRPWGTKGHLLSALYVRTVKRPQEEQQAKAPAPSFSTVLSPTAPVFVPGALDKKDTVKDIYERMRLTSDASTSLASSSEDPSSERCDSDAEVACKNSASDGTTVFVV